MGIESPVHLLFIAVVALIVLGPRRLPEVARALGQGIREFRGALENAATHDPEPEQASTQPALGLQASPQPALGGQASPQPALGLPDPSPSDAAQDATQSPG